MKLTRRFFIQSSGALAVYCGVAPLDRLLANSMDDPANHRVKKHKSLVVIFLRGGIDGLNWVVPYGDPAYAGLRPDLKVHTPGSENGAIDLDGMFGLNPRCDALMPWFDEGVAVAAHAVGYSKNSRSHFEEQDVWETGVAGNTIGYDGWLNRHLLTSEGHGPVRAIAFSDTMPRILRGDATAYAIPGLTALGLPKREGEDAAVLSALEHAYQVDPNPMGDAAKSAQDMVHGAGTDTLQGIKLIQEVAKQPYQPAAEYPERNKLAESLKSTARLLKADLGLEVVQIDYGGWDTHNRQGNGHEGNYGNKLQALSEALSAFAKDMGSQLDDTLVLTISDFGRTARQNGSGGTDHGWANAMLALGGPVTKTGEKTGIKQRRKVLTQWPGLAPDQLYQKRDLLHTTDFRDVLAEVVQTHLGNDNLPTVLPNHEFKNVGLIAS
jgi:uncharacterized protein (DUF1501 family)